MKPWLQVRPPLRSPGLNAHKVLAHKLQFDFAAPAAAKNTPLPFLVWNSLRSPHTLFADGWVGVITRRWHSRTLAPLTRQELALFNTAVALLRLALQDPLMRTSDGTIHAVLSISCLPPDSYAFDDVPLPKQSFLTTWRAMDTATGMNFSEQHLNGVEAVIKARGGIQHSRPELALSLSL
jgi:hypothetical protein